MGKGKGFIHEFEKFISRGNVMDMAVGVIIGGAFSSIITSLVDDILSNGQAILSLLELVSKAGGEVAGVGVAIEKAMRDGGRVLRRMGIRVEALATVEHIEGDRIILKD